MSIANWRLVLGYQSAVPDDVCVYLMPLAPLHDLNSRNPYGPLGRGCLSYVIELSLYFALVKAILRTDLPNHAIHPIVLERLWYHVLDVGTGPRGAVQRSV